jgi:stage III sporulation protein AA
MSPDIIMTDEIGCDGDRHAVSGVINSGVNIIATAHGYSMEELRKRRELLDIFDSNAFERCVVLSNSQGPGTLETVTDGSGRVKYYERGIK